MKGYKEIDKMWDEYIKHSTIEVSENVSLCYEASEVSGYKVIIEGANGSVSMSVKEAKQLVIELAGLMGYPL